MNAKERPAWVKQVEHADGAALIVVERTDGTLAGYRIARRSLRELADKERPH